MPNPPLFLRRRAFVARHLSSTLTSSMIWLLLATGCGGAAAAPESPSMMSRGPEPMAAASAMSDAPAAEAMPSPAPQAPVDQPAMYQADAAGPAPAAPMAGLPSAPGRAPQAAPRAPQVSFKKGAPPPPPPPKADAKAPPPTAKGEVKPPGEAPGPQAPVAPLLIYVGEMTVQVADDAAIPVTIDKVIDLAVAMGGYLAGRKDTSVQIRIPSTRFREGLQLIEKLGEVLHRSVTADDVSEQFSDLEVRLANLRATQKRLHEFLAKAGTIPDMLSVGQELDRVTAEIEQIEGKMRFLRSRAAFSVVTIALQPKPKIAVVAKVEPPPPLPREVTLPIDWLPRIGLDTLLNLSRSTP